MKDVKIGNRIQVYMIDGKVVSDTGTVIKVLKDAIVYYSDKTDDTVSLWKNKTEFDIYNILKEK